MPSSDNGVSGPSSSRHDRRRALVLAVLAFVVYNANLRVIGTGDSLPARLVPLVLLRWGTLALDRVEQAAQVPGYYPYWLQRDRAGRAVSAYPLVTPLLVTPVFVPAVVYLELRGWEPKRVRRVSEIGEKVAASLVTATSVGLMFLLLRRRASEPLAGLLTVAYAFGTNTWVTSSQALWQHGVGELLMVAGLALLTGRPTRARVIAAGLVIGLLPANRPPDALLALGLAAALPAWAGPATAVGLVAAAVPPALTLAYNLAVFAHPAGGYGHLGATQASFFSGSFLEGVVGMLVAPVSGLFVFAPFLLAVPLGARRIWAEPGHRRLVVALVAAMALQLALYAGAPWRGGYTYGARFLTDLLPILLWMLPPVIAALGRLGRAAFVAAVVFSIGVQAIGAFCFPSGRSYLIQETWRTTSFAFVVEARGGLARPTFVDYFGGLAVNLEAGDG